MRVIIFIFVTGALCAVDHNAKALTRYLIRCVVCVCAVRKQTSAKRCVIWRGNGTRCLTASGRNTSANERVEERRRAADELP